MAPMLDPGVIEPRRAILGDGLRRTPAQQPESADRADTIADGLSRLR